MNAKHHPETGLKRTQLYLTQAARDVLDLDCEILAKDERGRAYRKLSDRLGQILGDYATWVQYSMPTMDEPAWLEAFEQCRKLEQQGKRASDVDYSVPSGQSIPMTALAIADAYYRFTSFDRSLPVRNRLIAAGCKIDSN